MWEELIVDPDYVAGAWFGSSEGFGVGSGSGSGNILFFLPPMMSGGFWSGGLF